MIKKALIIIDFINDIVDLEGKFTATAKFCHTHHVIEKANQAISFARKESFALAFVKVGFSKNYSECSPYSPIFQAAKQHNALQLNQWGTFFHKDLDYKTEDFTIVKYRISAF